MPDAIEQLRTEAEADLTAVLRKLNREGRKRIKAAIAQYGSVAAIPDSVWEELKSEADTVAAAVMLMLLTGSYERTRRSLGVTMTADELEATRERARLSAAAMGREVAVGYVDGVRDRLVANIDQADSDLSVRQRSAVVNDVLDDEQLERTVSTSTTRGMTVGQVSAGNDEAQRQGVAIDYKWVTERDSRVCPICSPLHGKPSSQWEAITARTQTGRTTQEVLSGPPAHPNCRCKLEPYFPNGANYNGGPGFSTGGGVNVRN